MSALRPVIGVFDSGFGGLTVLREIVRYVPNAEYLYFGDTARLPYGAKSVETVARYAVGACHFLEDQGAEQLVIACNTATALAMDQIHTYAHVPAIGVVEPGAKSAAAITQTKNVAVIGTEATIASHAYQRALEKLGIQANEKATPLLVPLVEEGWVDHTVTQQVAEIYLRDQFVRTDRRCDVLLLGCTHYPLIRPLLRRVVPTEVSIVDSAESTARALAQKLGVGPRPAASAGSTQSSGARAASAPSAPEPTPGSPDFRFYVTDSVQKFRRLGSNFLGHPVDNVEHVDLGG
ncbi:MAG TPA: glutamate racemase [Candidatus Koribacter sp.]|jgi:glutamate racemase